ncbi:N/A [soil metagenome]
MTPTAALADNRLSDAIRLQSDIVNQNGDAAGRLFLVELLAVAGDYPNAWRHLNAIESHDEEWPRSRRHFRRMLKLLSLRRRGLVPQFLSVPAQHAKYRRLLQRAVHREETRNIVRLLDRADDRSPYLIGHVDGREFEGLRDADDRFGSVLEAFVEGEYVSIPLEQIRRIVIAPAVNLLDRAVRAVTIRLVSKEEFGAMVPLTYPAHYELPDEDSLALGLDTDRCEEHGGITTARGGKLLLTEAEEVFLGECQQIDVRVGE